MASIDDELVLGATVRLVGEARRMVEWYAGDFAPVRTDQMAELLQRSGCRLSIFPFRSQAVAFAAPPVAGVYPIAVNRAARRTDRQFALRHELAHVLAGDVDEPTYLTDCSSASHAERAADLFALADLVPSWFLAWLRRQRMSWRDVRAEVRRAIATYAGDWPAERLEDRAGLRVRLYRECGV